jgi:hypothetical protein
VKDILVTLSASETKFAAIVGVERQVSNLSRGLRDKHGAEGRNGGDGFPAHITGALGEAAVAKFLNRFWLGAIGDFGAADVGNIQVRTRRGLDDDLCITPEDLKKRPNDRFILVSWAGPDDPFSWILRGWIRAKEAAADADPRISIAQGALLFVPREHLREIKCRERSSEV